MSNNNFNKFSSKKPEGNKEPISEELNQTEISLSFSRDEANAMLAYLQTKPWNEVNGLMNLIIGKIQNA